MYTEIIFSDEQELVLYLEEKNMNEFVFINPDTGSKEVRKFSLIKFLVLKDIEKSSQILELQTSDTEKSNQILELQNRVTEIERLVVI